VKRKCKVECVKRNNKSLLFRKGNLQKALKTTVDSSHCTRILVRVHKDVPHQLLLKKNFYRGCPRSYFSLLCFLSLLITAAIQNLTATYHILQLFQNIFKIFLWRFRDSNQNKLLRFKINQVRLKIKMFEKK
jgi:hypothetical protein